MVARSVERFATSPVVDAYTGRGLGFCHLHSEPISERDAAPATRRVMTAPPSYIPPARSVVEIEGTYYLIGRMEVDTHRGHPVRVTCMLQQADGRATVKTLAQACTGQGGMTAYASRRQVGSTVTQQESLTVLKWDVTFAGPEVLVPGTLVRLGDTWHYVRSVRISDTSLTVCETDEIGPGAVSPSTVQRDNIDRVTEIPHPTKTDTTTVLLPWTSEFLVGHGPQGRPQPGQRTLALPAGLAEVGCKVERGEGVWLVQGLEPHPPQGLDIARVRQA